MKMLMFSRSLKRKLSLIVTTKKYYIFLYVTFSSNSSKFKIFRFLLSHQKKKQDIVFFFRWNTKINIFIVNRCLKNRSTITLQLDRYVRHGQILRGLATYLSIWRYNFVKFPNQIKSDHSCRKIRDIVTQYVC